MRARLASVLHWCLCDNRPMSPSTIAILNSVKKAVESSGRSVGLPPFTMCPEGPGEPTERGESTGWLQGSRRPGPPSPSPSKHFCLLSLNKGLWGLGVTGSKTILFMMEDRSYIFLFRICLVCHKKILSFSLIGLSSFILFPFFHHSSHDRG